MTIWHTYILRCADGSLYTGITTDIQARLRTHAAGKGGAYTRSHLPVKLAWSEQASSGTEARKREYEIKCWSKAVKESFIQNASMLTSPKLKQNHTHASLQRNATLSPPRKK